jgi:RimJ/RimL family protein N-acetyltransferase
MRTIETPRLILRPLLPEDESFYCRLHGDADVMRHIAAPLTPEAASRVFGSTLARNRNGIHDDQCWAITHRDNPSPIGVIGWHRLSAPMHRVGELGAILSNDAQGRGISIEAGQALMDFAFGNDVFEALLSEHAIAHHYAAIMMGRLGFAREESREDAPAVVVWRMSKARWGMLRRQPA